VTKRPVYEGPILMVFS